MQRSTDVDSRFIEIETKIDQLTHAYEDRLRALSTFNDPRALDARIDALTRQISDCIARLRDEIRRDVQPSAAGTQKQLQTNMQLGHVSRLRRITMQFRDMQTDYMRRFGAAEAKASAASGLDPDGEVSLDPDFDVSFTGEQQTAVIERDLMVQQRNQHLQEVLRSMNRLQEMFADLGTLIIEQGTILDRIDRTIDAAVEDVDTGNSNLKQAEEHQKSSGKCFYIYIVLMVVVILILGSIILIRKKNRTSDGGGDSSGGETA
jgi:syntaxin 16